ncbi:MAG: thiamine pyrophosphate-dependent enzyme [Pseudomonadota bacterium]
MTDFSLSMTAGQVLAKALKAHDVDTVFGVAGESYLAVLDALYDTKSIKFITNRQEGGAAFMAEAYAKLTGKTGICFVTRGPGATNASIGVHTAKQDSTPMILFIGQVARDQMGREAFQEVEYRCMFEPPFAKAVFQVEHADDMAQVVAEAFLISQSERKGPVVIALPEDMLREKTDKIDIRRLDQQDIQPRHEELPEIGALLSKAKKPVAILGGSGWDDENLAAFESFAEKHHLPVAAAFRRQDLFRHTHPCYIGELGTGPNPALAKAIREDADLVLAVNTRLGEITSQGYTLFDIPDPRQKLIHVYPDEAELGKVYAPDLAVNTTPDGFIRHLAELEDSYDFSRWCKTLRQSYEDWTVLDKTTPDFEVDMDMIFKHIRNTLPKDAIITTDAGNFSGWAQRYLRYGRPNRLLAPTSGAMGYGVPAAIAASIAAPEPVVIGMMGDGGFMMTGQELATAVSAGATPIILLFNNGIYGTIRMHQARDYPGRKIATDLTNPDFTALAKAYGAEAYCIEKTEDFYSAFDEALENRKLTVIEIRNNPEQITTSKRLSDFE